MNPSAATQTSMTEPTIENEEYQSMIVDGEGLLNVPEQLERENIKKSFHPPTLGGIFWTSKSKSVKDIDRARLNAIDGPNNNRKRRPWIIVEELTGGEVRVMSSTTQKDKGWDAVAKEHQQYFLPISPTVSNGRPVLEMREDFDGRFVGKSLLYLCIEMVIHASALDGEKCMGYLEESAVAIIRRERELILEAERAARPERMREEKWPRNTNWRQRNRANSRNCSDRGLNGGGFSDDTTRQSQDPHANHIVHQNHNPDQDSHSQPNQHPGPTQAQGWNENPPLQYFSPPQTCTIGRSSDPSRTDPTSRANTQEHLRQGQIHCQTGERMNKNGSRKRRERAARGELSRQGR